MRFEEARSIVLRHLVEMTGQQDVTAEDMHALHPEMTVWAWNKVLWDMGRVVDGGNLLHSVGIRDVCTRWALTAKGWAAARRLQGEAA